MAAIHFEPQEECNAHIRKQLGQLAEPKFQQFMAKLLPGVENILGVRLPMLRQRGLEGLPAPCLQWEL